MGLRPPNFDSKQLFLILCARHRVHNYYVFILGINETYMYTIRYNNSINQEGGENAREGSVNRTI